MKLKAFIKKIQPYALPGLITLAVVVFTMIFKGIWPFGSSRIDYFDNMQQVAPLYTHLWDFMHGKASLWFDWYTGLGTSVTMSISAFSMLSPFNVLLYLIPRDLILESISILTAVKMVFMSVAMYVYLDKKYEGLLYQVKTGFAVLYSLCGYVLLYASCFTPWMDIVALFPVFMYAYDRMIKTGKKLFYICMVGILFIINYYLAAMSLVYIFLISGVYILLVCERKEWKSHAWNLGIGTVTGIGLSAFVLIPVMMQLSSSQRGSSGSSIIGQYIGWIRSAVVTDGAMAAFQRYMMLYGLSFVLAVIIVGIRKFKSDKKMTRYTLAMLGIALLPMIVEGINLMWHFGSYNGYTLRNGFLIAFTLISLAAYYGEKMFNDYPLEKKYYKRQVIIAAAICVVYAVGYNLIPYNNEIIATIFFMAVLITMTIVYIRKLTEEKEEFNVKSVIAVVAVEVFFGAYALIGPPKFYSYEAYQVGDYVEYANAVYEELEIEDSATDRIVNPDISLNANYPLILRRGALSSFTAALQSDTQTFAKNWGYSKYFLWLLDSGGTVFTNALFHVTEAVNVNELDPVMYTLEREAGDYKLYSDNFESESGSYKLYSANYQLPFAMTVSASFANEDLGGDWVSLHNKFYKALTGDTQDLVTGISNSVKVSDTVLEYTAKVDGYGAVYMNIVDVNNRDSDANASWLISSMHIYVNDEPVVIPTLGDVENTAYFTDYNNNLVYLGCFKDELINIRVEYDDAWFLKVSEVSFAQLNMDKMQSLCDMYKDSQCEVTYTNDSLTVKVNGTATNNYALIPVIYSDNWTVTVDGQEVSAREIAGLFTGVKIHSGENTIVFKFEAKGKREGTLISFAVILILLVCLIINHFKKIKMPAWIEYCALFVYLQLYNAVIVFMFLIPVLCSIPALIYQLVMKIM
jgi:uncharacterized membrane protein YfhO